MTTVAIYGDIQGNVDAFRSALIRAGADPATMALPAGLTTVQVGDLVHRGPESAGVVHTVTQLLANNADPSAGSHVQLAGNHETIYLWRDTFRWDKKIELSAAQQLRSWWADGRMKVASCVRTASGERLLITHAGLTLGLWRELGSPADPEDAADLLNGLIPDAAVLRRAGLMLADRWPNISAGPLWAEAGQELYQPWADYWLETGKRLPFSQVHGHSQVFWFDRNAWNIKFPRQRLRPYVRVDQRRRHVTLQLGESRIVGIDAGHGTHAARSWAPLTLTDAAVTR